MMSTLAEDLLILSLPDYTGRAPGTAFGLDQALSGAVIIDLMTQGLVKADTDGRLQAVDRASADDGILKDALQKIAAKRGMTTREWISRLAWEKPRLRARLLLQMRDHGTVQRERRRWLGLLPRDRFYVLDPTPATRLRQDIRRALLLDRQCDPRTVVLISLLSAAQILGAQFARSERKLARRRAEELLKSDAITKAVADWGGAEAAVSAIIAATKKADDE